MGDPSSQQLPYHTYVEQVPGFGVGSVNISSSPNQRAASGSEAGLPGAVRPNGNAAGRGRVSTGSIFFKTKLCSRFRAGNCPYNSNCNFAHGMEELRKPPPGWEEFVTPQDGSKDANNAGGAQKTRPCKKFFSEGSCPYGDRCIFFHEDPATNPSTVAAASVAPTAPIAASGGGNARPPNWKTRLCNKWETTGHCPFGEKCHFAHGMAELQKYGGGPADSPSIQPDPKGPQGLLNSKTSDVPSASLPFGMDAAAAAAAGGQLRQSFILQPAAPPQQAGAAAAAGASKPAHVAAVNLKVSAVWRGPTEGISTIYGDWLEEDEWEEDEQELRYNQPGPEKIPVY